MDSIRPDGDRAIGIASPDAWRCPIVRRSRAGDSTPTSDFLISFGDKTGSAGTFSLGRAFSLGDLSHLLTKMGISNDVTDRAVHAMMGQPSHEIPNVRLSKGLLTSLGL